MNSLPKAQFIRFLPARIAWASSFRPLRNNSSRDHEQSVLLPELIQRWIAGNAQGRVELAKHGESATDLLQLPSGPGNPAGFLKAALNAKGDVLIGLRIRPHSLQDAFFAEG